MISNNIQNFLLKLYFDEKTKRSALPKDFMSLREISKMSFASSNLMEPFEIYYMDDEKELILIESQFDYENACLLMLHGQNNQNKTLKVSIKSINEKYEDKLAVKFLECSIINNSINISKIISLPVLEQIIIENEITNFSCYRCGRKFSNQNSHAKHSIICSKVFGNKRKPFDSKKQRQNEAQQQKLIKMNDKINDKLLKLQSAMNKWKIACSKLQNNLRYIERPFRKFFPIEVKHCSKCRRKFEDSDYKEHIKSCYKIVIKRKPFDSKKQRIINLEQAAFIKKQESLKTNKYLINLDKEEKDKYKGKPRWQRLSERFRNIMRICKLLYKTRC